MSKKIKIFLLILIMIFNTLAFSPSAKATWPDFLGFSFGAALDQIAIQVRAAILTALKQAAIDTLNDTINNLVSGTTQAGALFIQDWEDYLFKSPRGKAGAQMNDFFTITTRGKSSGNFSSNCGGTSFTEWRSADAKESVGVEIDLTSLQSDFEEYACDAASMFDKGSWDAYSAFMQPKNNPIAYTLNSMAYYEKVLNEEAKEAELKAVSYGGYKASEKNGIVIAPGTLISDITSSANTIGDSSLANAKEAGEIVGLVVGKIATKVIKQGVGNARQNIQNKINDGICDTSQGIRDELKGLNPNGSLPGGVGVGSLGKSSGNKSCNLR